MSPLLRRSLQSLGLGLVFIFHSLFPLMSSNAMVFYHSSTSMHTVVQACWLDMLLGMMFFLALWFGTERAGVWLPVQFVIACIMPWVLFVQDPSLLYSLWQHIRAHVPEAAIKPGTYVAWNLSPEARYVVLIVWIIVVFALHRWLPRIYRHLIVAGGISLAGLGLFAFQGMFYLAKARSWRPDQGASLALQEQHTSAPHARIVWIVLDELSYAQAFEDRPADLRLPNMDLLAAESDVFTQVQPIGYWTHMIIPSIFLGQPIDAMIAAKGRRPLISSGGAPFTPYSAEQTVTADAERLGWNVGIVGWYNPYCAILSGTFQKCYWTFRENTSGPMLADSSTRQNMVAAVVNYDRLEELGAGISRSEDETLFAKADELLRDDAMDFIFLHFPLPHPPGVWDRKKNDWAVTDGATYRASYEDNLALTDRELGHILQLLQSDPRWAETTVIVHGDHSWRVPMWRDDESWTREDEQRSHGGQFDVRPALLVHAPGQTVARKVSGPVSLMQVHTMLESALGTGQPFPAGKPDDLR